MRRAIPKKVAIGAAVVCALWLLLAFVVGPALIRLGYDGGGGRLLSGVFAGRDANPVDTYLDAWYLLARLGTIVLGATIAVGFLGLSFPDARKAGLSRLVGGEADMSDGTVLWYGTCLGLVGGGAEATYSVLRHLVTQRPAAGFYWELLWMGPLSAALAALLVSLGLVWSTLR